MNRVLTYEITAEQAGTKIGDFLRRAGYSRHVIIHLKKTENGILLNGEWAYVGQFLKEGDHLEIRIIESESSEQIVPAELPLDIVYEDEDLLIINKPADMPIHPSINNYNNTLANALMWYYQQKGETFVYRCINRLDRDTTGLLIVAKNMLSGGSLSDMSKKREIQREYLAIAEGEVPQEGVIDAPIARKEESVIERCVDFEKGDRAVTHYWRLDYRNGYSLVRLKLETGRTHQIRVHMKYIGYPLTGDYLYNPDYRILDHQALHSWKLAFRHPVTGAQMQFKADPPWKLP
ncbi:RluA family pseudouridine synthase [Jingyaoa shaoxingensis]|uniref:Pseudouridine synthase n=1 Tax=Jingyaoa shaoxingensis TaxID=2763671 RepID=A0ABR7N603_9FIRM|nr:RluA family pseudouridine synthase [Jingyaoa shaoxingensis]MBC8571832.1 RluA family pseudouridine synthase [Jingyaoa shaoxingensis]